MKSKIFIPVLATAAFLFSIHSTTAQVTHTVEVLPSSFVPLGLDIEIGDTVEWINQSGIHNVNGSTETFPGNPESFGNELGADWTYSFVFTIPGFYEYHCDAHFGMGMVGAINVVDVSTSVASNESDASLVRSVYPVPAVEFVTVELNLSAITNASLELMLIDQLGRTIQSQSIVSSDRFEIDVRHLHSGMYFFQLIDGDQTLHTGRLIVR